MTFVVNILLISSWLLQLYNSKFLLFKLVEEMATSAGLQCELDPVLCEALRVHKGEFFFVNALLTDKSCVMTSVTIFDY